MVDLIDHDLKGARGQFVFPQPVPARTSECPHPRSRCRRFSAELLNSATAACRRWCCGIAALAIFASRNILANATFTDPAILRYRLQHVVAHIPRHIRPKRAPPNAKQSPAPLSSPSHPRTFCPRHANTTIIPAGSSLQPLFFSQNP